MLLTSGLIQGSFSGAGMEPRPHCPLNPTCFGEGPAGHSGHEQGVAPCPVSPRGQEVQLRAAQTSARWEMSPPSRDRDTDPAPSHLGFTIPHPQNRC